MTAVSDNQERIVERVAELFKRYGVRSVTMDDIANRLSISKKTIYQHFKDKKEVVVACVRHIFDKEFADLQAIEARSENVVEELFLLSSYFRSMMEHMNPSLLFDLQKYHADAWEIYLEQKEHCYLSKMQEALLRGKEQGYIRSEIDIEVVSRMRMEVVEMGFNPDVFPPDRYNLAHVQLQLFDHFFYGVTTPAGQALMEQYKAGREEGLRGEASQQG